MPQPATGKLCRGGTSDGATV